MVLWFRPNDVGTRIFIARCAAGGTSMAKSKLAEGDNQDRARVAGEQDYEVRSRRRKPANPKQP